MSNPLLSQIHRLSIENLLKMNPYINYVYAYPHKTSYRFLDKPINLKQLWSTEQKNSLFMYIHIPFCELKCSYCNLFSVASSKLKFITKYIRTLERQAKTVYNALENASVARLALGGGTPTYLSCQELEQLFNIATDIFDVNTSKIPISVETSPNTVEDGKMEVLKDNNVERISIGVQSILANEAKALGRSQNESDVIHALNIIKSFKFPVLNVDLIYGIPGQTVSSFCLSIEKTLEFTPEEFYLYPLYIRPLTVLGEKHLKYKDIRLECYKAGRDKLLEAGYKQLSMRMFTLKAKKVEEPIKYTCQEDGMIGLGCGARSYTRGVHYSDEYAVKGSWITKILLDYVSQKNKDFGTANFGIKLSREDQYRRYVIKTILKGSGLNLKEYSEWFGSDVFNNLPELNELIKKELLVYDKELNIHEKDCLKPTALGYQYSDLIGPWLFSKNVRQLMEDYKIR